MNVPPGPAPGGPLDVAQYEKLGAFYLGRVVDRATRDLRDEVLLYDAKDLTTHGLVVGMTGSGKTGLSVGLIEEAALDGIPTLIIDPKGDLANLLLTFPKLRPGDFEPWIDPGEASRHGETVAERARSVAELWRRGLADWGQGPERIQRLRDAVEMTIYTPGSTAGLPLRVLQSLEAPREAVRADSDALRERVEGCVAGLLGLLGIAADPVQSREHILLANLLDGAWRAGRRLDLGTLIQEIQRPPFEKLGVMDLETFYPAKERMQLALRINNLLASPGFAAWMEGESLDVGALLFREDGRPRISIVSIAHLSDAERMFLVTLLLNEVVSWMRSLEGTSSLRALLYMDEIFGFFPPSAEPPSKKPMLTLLKQARAYGLGVLLATQNPVDLDYKGLSNCGTWFIGRLQTERDKERVLAGLEAATASAGQRLDRGELDLILGSLGKRVFLMNNVHEDQPVLFRTRWAMSYLRGPLVRRQIETLMSERRPGTSASRAETAAPEMGPVAETVPRPVLPDGVDEAFLPATIDPDPEARLVYRPSLLGKAQLHFRRSSAEVDDWRQVTVIAPLAESASALEWGDATVLDGGGPPTRKRPASGASFCQLPAVASRQRSLAAAGKKLITELYRGRRLELRKYRPLKMVSELDESEASFRQRVVTALAERRDREIEKLRAKYASEVESLERRIAAAEERLSRERSQLQDRKLQTAVSFGASVLGALMGRKKLSVTTMNRAGRAMRDVGRSRKEKDDVERAEERLEDLLERKAELESELEDDLEELRRSLPSAAEVQLEEVSIPPLKSDIAVDRLAILWQPWSVSKSSGLAEPLFELEGRPPGA